MFHKLQIQTINSASTPSTGGLCHSVPSDQNLKSSHKEQLQDANVSERELIELRNATIEKDAQLTELRAELERTKYTHRTEVERLRVQCRLLEDKLTHANQSMWNHRSHDGDNQTETANSTEDFNSLITRWNNATLLFEDQAGSLTENINLLRIIPSTNPMPPSDEASFASSHLISEQDTTSDYTTNSSPSPIGDFQMVSNEAAGDNRPFGLHTDQLLRERSELVFRLDVIRAHLVQVKAQWDGCLRESGHQINQLKCQLSAAIKKCAELELSHKNILDQLRQEIVQLKTELAKYKRSCVEETCPHDSMSAKRLVPNRLHMNVPNTGESHQNSGNCSGPDELVTKLQERLSQQDRLIKLQQKRLKEMRKVLADQSKSKHNLSDRDSIEGLVTGHMYFSRSNSLDRSSTNSSQSCTRSGILNFTASNLTEEITMKANDEQNNNNPSYNASINHKYLRHVLLKFLLSRENEAIQLVRVLSAILCMSAEEETLIKQTLTTRRSWFRYRPRLSPSKSRGQFARIIPPSP